MVTKEILEKDYPAFTSDFSQWFSMYYKIPFDVFDEGKLSDHVMSINDFLGLQMTFYEGHNFKLELKKTMVYIKKYNDALLDIENVVNFEQMMRTMPQEECFAEFLKQKTKNINISLKDALRRIHEDKQDEPPPKSQNAPIREKIDTFWDDAKKHTSSESPF